MGVTNSAMNSPTHLDLFSGIGGFSLAFEAEGFRTVAFSEINPDKITVYEYQFPGARNIGDIRGIGKFADEMPACDCCDEPWCELHGEHWADCSCCDSGQLHDEIGGIDVITGGVPCQPASLLGKRCGTDDERWLWPETLRVVGAVRPRFAVFENPPALLTLEDGRAFNGILSGLVALGYDCMWDVLPAAAFGAGHLRERLILIAADAESIGKRITSDKNHTVSDGGESWNGVAGVADFKTPIHADDPRLQGHAGHVENSEGRETTGRSIATPDLRGRVRDFGNGLPWWHEVNTGVPVLAHGLPSRLVEAACRCAGDAVVPQVIQPIARAIRERLKVFLPPQQHNKKQK